MSWAEILPLSPTKNAKAVVSMSSAPATGGRGAATYVTIRPGHGIAWIKLGASCKIEHDQSGAQLRLSAGGPFLITKTGGIDKGSILLRIPRLVGQKLERQRSTPCAHRVADGGSLIIDLPFWAIPTAPATPTATTVKAAPPQKPTAFKMAGSSEADDRVPATFADVLHWATHNGVSVTGQQPVVVARVNAARERFALPPFRLDPNARPMDKMPRPSVT